jgi:hypothetical protein
VSAVRAMQLFACTGTGRLCACRPCLHCFPSPCRRLPLAACTADMPIHPPTPCYWLLHNQDCTMPFTGFLQAPLWHYFMHLTCCMHAYASSPGMVGPFGISFCCSGSSAGLNSGVLGVYSG